jgi:hypothetical protein
MAHAFKQHTQMYRKSATCQAPVYETKEGQDEGKRVVLEFPLGAKGRPGPAQRMRHHACVWDEACITCRGMTTVQA